MDKVLKSGQTAPNMKATTRMVRNMVMAASLLPMEATILDSLRTTRFQVLVSTYGLMARFMKATGRKIKCTDKVFSFGVTVNNTKVTS